MLNNAFDGWLARANGKRRGATKFNTNTTGMAILADRFSPASMAMVLAQSSDYDDDEDALANFEFTRGAMKIHRWKYTARGMIPRVNAVSLCNSLTSGTCLLRTIGLPQQVLRHLGYPRVS